MIIGNQEDVLITHQTSGLSESESSDSLDQMMRAANPHRSVLGATPDALPKHLCNQRIAVQSRLGAGAMGTVYAASDAGRPVALKSLNHFSPADIYRLKNEFRQLSKLTHPNLVMVYELFHDPPFWFFTMERVAGQSLDRYWAALPVKDGAVIRHLMRQIVEGVCAIHDSGLVHRDLKPSNIMVETTGRVVVVDFGLVSGQHVGSEGATVAGQVCGTPAYMAPEQFFGEPASAASDWYSVGVVLWELMVGHCPFNGPVADLVRQKKTALPSLDGAAIVDDELTRLCQRLTQRDPNERPSSVELYRHAQTWHRVPQAPSVDSRRGGIEPLVGRREPLRVLADSYRSAIAGRPTLVWISGPSGIGKSRLLEGFSEQLAAEDAPVVLKGRCVEREFVPHKAFDGVVDHFSRLARQLPSADTAQLVPKHPRAVGQLFPVLLRIGVFEKAVREQRPEGPDVDALASRRRGLAGFKDLLHRLAERRHLVLFLEDMQWADEDSWMLLRELLTPPDPPAMLIIATSREVLSYDASLDACSVRISLDPLGLEESQRLVVGVLPEGLPDRETRALELARQAAGHPLYLVELARAFAAIDGETSAWSLAGLFERRIAALDVDARGALELLVLAGRSLSLATLLELCGPSAERMMRTLRAELLVRHSPQHVSPQFELEHDHVVQVTRSLMTDAARRAVHTRLAEWLLGIPDADPEWLVTQLVLAGSTEQAGPHAARAARSAAARLAFSAAVSLFALALEYAPQDTALRIEYAEALSAAKRCDEAAQQYRLAAERAGQGGQAVNLRARAATQWIRAGYLREGIAELRGVLAAVDVAWPESDASIILRYLWQRSRIARLNLKQVPPEVNDAPRDLTEKLEALAPASTVLGAFDYIRGGYFSTLALPLAFRTGHTRFLVNAVGAEAVYRAMSAGTGADVAIAELATLNHALNLPPEHSDYRRGVGELVRAMSEYWSGRWAAVDAPAKAGELVFDTLVPGASWEGTLLRSIRHTAHLQRAPGELEAVLPSLIRDAEERSDLYALSDLKLVQAGVELARSGADGALVSLRGLEYELDRTQLSVMRHLVVCVNVQVLLELEQAREADALLHSEWRALRKRGLDRFPLVRAAFLGMQADVTCASVHLAASERVRTLKRLAARMEGEPLGVAPGLTASIRCAAAELDGRSDQARAYSRQARVQLESAGLTLAALCETTEWDPTGPDARAMQQRGVQNPTAWRRRRRCFL